MKLEVLEGRKSLALRDLIDEPMVVELANGEVYGGLLEAYDVGGVIALYSCMLLDRKSRKWIGHDFTMTVDGELRPDPMPEFRLADIKDVFVLPEAERDKLYLDDVLHIYIDPYFKPLLGIPCEWHIGEKQEKHSAECDAPLHEALVFLKTATGIGFNNNDELYRRSEEGFAYVRRRLLRYGARIP